MKAGLRRLRRPALRAEDGHHIHNDARHASRCGGAVRCEQRRARTREYVLAPAIGSTWMNPRTLLEQLFAAAIEAAQPAHCIPPHLPQVPRWPPDRHRRRQGVGGDGARGRGALARPPFRAGGHPLRLCGALRAHRNRRSRTSGAGRGGARCRAAFSIRCRALAADDSCCA